MEQQAQDTSTTFTFRPVTPADMPLLARWVKAPAVAEWWRDEAEMSYEEICREFDPAKRAAESVRSFIFSINRRPSGYIQTYPVDAHPDSLAMFKTPGAHGIDLFIGEEELLYRGFGPKLLRRFIDEHIFSDPAVTTCVIDPDVRNAPAIRAYEKTGFMKMREEVSPDDGLAYTVMRLDRT